MVGRFGLFSTGGFERRGGLMKREERKLRWKSLMLRNPWSTLILLFRGEATFCVRHRSPLAVRLYVTGSDSQHRPGTISRVNMLIFATTIVNLQTRSGTTFLKARG